MKRLLTSLALGGMVAALAAPVIAQEHAVNIFGNFGSYNYDNGRRMDNTEVWGLGFGFNIDERWAVEAVYHEMDGARGDTAAEVDGRMYHLDGLYHLRKYGSVTPFLALGMGEIKTDDGFNHEKESALNFGGGLKAAFTDALSVRVDARLIHGFDSHSWDNMLTIGLNYAFGGRSSAAPAPAPRPAAAAAPVDSDGDGVIDAQDRCPGTPAGVRVDARGCPLDSDGDGVPDHLDQCPNTPAGARVDERGCEIMITEAVSVELEVLFDTDKAEVKPQFHAEIRKVADFMREYPSTSATIEGHTDSSGPDAYNQRLSQQRAEAVRMVLINQHNVAANRLRAVGYGESRPRASNDTAAGKQQNRRVVAVIQTEVTRPAQ